jgi:glycosyltransferase involved in cell wall biosynthesis
MNNIDLTIAIPTYNRNKTLKKNIVYLLPQLNESIKLIIIDNASSEPISETLNEIINQNTHLQISIIRNKLNVGGNNNILRCLEYCETDYLWILGDDDIPRANAIQNILNTIRKNPDSCFINFSNDGVERSSSIKTKGINNFLSHGVDFLGQIIFISSCIYSAKKLKESFTISYSWALTHAPQLILVLDYLKNHDDASCYISNEKIVDTDHQNTDNLLMSAPIYVAMFIPTLMSLPIEKISRNILEIKIKQLIHSWLTPRTIFLSLLKIAIDQNRFVDHVYVYKEISRRLFYLEKSLFFRIEVFLYSIMLRLPTTSYFIVKKILKKKLHTGNVNRF